MASKANTAAQEGVQIAVGSEEQAVLTWAFDRGLDFAEMKELVEAARRGEAEPPTEPADLILDIDFDVPSKVPAGFQIVAHNHVLRRGKQHPNGVQGFRVWAAQQGGQVKYVACDCGWAPKLAAHYRVSTPRLDAAHENSRGLHRKLMAAGLTLEQMEDDALLAKLKRAWERESRSGVAVTR